MMAIHPAVALPGDDKVAGDIHCKPGGTLAVGRVRVDAEFPPTAAPAVV